MVEIRRTLIGIERCPQCGVASPTLTYQSFFTDPYDQASIRPAWFIYRCESCGDLVAAKGEASITSLQSSTVNYLVNYTTYAERIIPEPITIDSNLPERPRTYLSQALSTIHAPDGAVMLAGSAIDAMLKIKGLKDGSVYARIEKAVEDGILTKDMSKWAHAVRLESNKPRHADLDEPHATKEQALLVLEFAKALGDFLFVLPARVAAGVKAAQELSPAET